MYTQTWLVGHAALTRNGNVDHGRRIRPSPHVCSAVVTQYRSVPCVEDGCPQLAGMRDRPAECRVGPGPDALPLGSSNAMRHGMVTDPCAAKLAPRNDAALCLDGSANLGSQEHAPRVTLCGACEGGELAACGQREPVDGAGVEGRGTRWKGAALGGRNCRLWVQFSSTQGPDFSGRGWGAGVGTGGVRVAGSG